MLPCLPVVFCVALLCSVVPRQVGSKDLTPIERGVADAMNGMVVTSGKMKRKLGATHIAKGLKRSRSAVQKYIGKKTHAKPRGPPRGDYTDDDVDKAVAANEGLRKRFHNMRFGMGSARPRGSRSASSTRDRAPPRGGKSREISPDAPLPVICHNSDPSGFVRPT